MVDKKNNIGIKVEELCSCDITNINNVRKLSTSLAETQKEYAAIIEINSCACKLKEFYGDD